MPDEIRSFNLQVIGLTTGGSAAGVLGGLVDDLLEFEVPAAVVESVEPRLREDLIEMFLYPPGRDRSFRPTHRDKLLAAVDKELQTMTTFGTVVRAWRTDSLTITVRLSATWDPDPDPDRLVNVNITLVGEDPLVFPPDLIETILEYTTQYCNTVAVRNGGSAATSTTWNYPKRPLFYLTEWNPYRRETPPTVFSYGWIEVLAPELVERLGGLDTMSRGCPAHRVVPYECPTGTGAILQATPQPSDLTGETLQTWRDWLQVLFPPLRSPGPDRDCRPTPTWITQQDLELCPSWQPGWLPTWER
ncbi:MAG TPA: hypothetical protein ENI86_03215 [Acidimicrobiales bacterium]|nr:hypothetical protein [Acidimicrobiales bacterium]